MCDRELELDEDLDYYDYTPDGYNIETGKYNPDRDAFYPYFKALADAEKQVLGRRTF